MATNDNWVNNIAHPQILILKKYIYQILGDRYLQNEELIERVAMALPTQRDLESFGKFVVDIFEVAYLKCVEDHRDALEKSGQKAIIMPGKISENSHSIFQEKSG